VNTFQILTAYEDSLLDAMNKSERTVQIRKWNEAEKRVRDAFTGTKLDAETLVKMANSGELRPTFQPTIDRMLQHPDVKIQSIEVTA
jgi:hypothetical protein